MDDVDRHILSILLPRASVSKAEIARQIGLTPSAVSYRIRALEESGVIQAYETRLRAASLRYDVLAFVFVRESKPTDDVDTGQLLAKVSGVEEVHKIAGEDCFLVKMRAEDTARLGAVLDAEIGVIPTVSGIRTSIVLRTVLEAPPLSGTPLTEAASAEVDVVGASTSA